MRGKEGGDEKTASSHRTPDSEQLLSKADAGAAKPKRSFRQRLQEYDYRGVNGTENKSMTLILLSVSWKNQDYR